MKFLLVTLALLGDPSVSQVSSPSAPVASPLPASTVEEIAASVQTGSILASQGDCLAVRVYSLSSYTHVATVVVQDGKPIVFDTVPATGVRRLPLADYLISQQPTDLQLLHPSRKFSDAEAKAFEKSLVEQLGRPYDVKHFATGRRCQGLHCSEYVTDALIASHRVVTENPARVSPSGLIKGLTEHDIYTLGTTHVLPEPPEPPPADNESWCGWVWRGTKECTHDCWTQTKRWFCCK